jgi:hypothetical protein
MPAVAIPRKVRRNPRAQVSLVARYRSPTAFEYVEEECHDLSLGGMFIRSLAPAPAGTLIKLECDIGEGSTMIRGVARVVWLRDSPGNGQPAGMGVKFIKLEAGGRDAIKGILDQLATGKREGAGAAPNGELLESQRVRRNDSAADQLPAEPGDGGPSDPPPDSEFDAGSDATSLDAAASRNVGDREELESLRAVAGARDRKPLIYGAVVAIALAAGIYAVSSGPASSANPPTAPTPDTAVKTMTSEPAAPAPPTAAPPYAAEPQIPIPVPPPIAAGAKYMLDVLTDPSGALAQVGGQSMQTPARFEFDGFSEPISLELEKNGFESVTLKIDERGFELEDGSWHRRLVISLRPMRRSAKSPRPATSAKSAAPSAKAGQSASSPGRNPPAAIPDAPQSRLKTATTCLSRGDNACVIQTLEGKASSAREHEMLIETYRAVGNLPKAQRAMRAYVGKYPTGDRAATYRQLLQRQDKGAQAR